MSGELPCASSTLSIHYDYPSIYLKEPHQQRCHQFQPSCTLDPILLATVQDIDPLCSGWPNSTEMTAAGSLIEIFLAIRNQILVGKLPPILLDRGFMIANSFFCLTLRLSDVIVRQRSLYNSTSSPRTLLYCLSKKNGLREIVLSGNPA